MDALLGRHAEAGTPAGFAELVAFYRAHPETHLFGMDRLDDAEAMPLMTPAALHALALGNINASDALIRKVMREADVDALIALDFVDWWAIAGAPSLTVPIGTDDEAAVNQRLFRSSSCCSLRHKLTYWTRYWH